MTLSGVGTGALKMRDADYENLHDADPVDYHMNLARLHITCGFCEYRKKSSVKRETEQ